MGQTVVTNRKAFRDYTFSDKMECGISLIGAEVKSVRAGKAAFKDTFARIEKGQVYIYNLHIEPYQQASYMNEDPDRKRKLLMHKREIMRLEGKIAQSGKTLVPTKLYFNNRGILKIELGVGKGKKMYDKRESIKKRDMDREMSRAVRQRR